MDEPRPEQPPRSANETNVPERNHLKLKKKGKFANRSVSKGRWNRRWNGTRRRRHSPNASGES